MQLITKLRQRLGAGDPVWGAFMHELRSPGAVHMLAQSGFDYIIIDGEHGTHDLSTIRHMIESAHAAGICPLVRSPGLDRGFIHQVLDAGGEGIVFPQLRTAEEARQAVQFSKYAPMGSRGVHTKRPHTNFKAPDWRTFFDEANRNLLTAIQIETRGAVDEVDEIAALEGVDCLYLGPSDLSTELGCPGQFDDPGVVRAIREVAEAAQRHGKIAAFQMGKPEQADQLMKIGYRALSCGSGLGFLADGARRVLERLQQANA